MIYDPGFSLLAIPTHVSGDTRKHVQVSGVRDSKTRMHARR